jgi:hypothetical protein
MTTPTLTANEMTDFLKAKGTGRGAQYYRNIEARKKKKMGSFMYGRRLFLKSLKKHLSTLIMGKGGRGMAPEWQIEQIRVMMGRCPFRRGCKQNKALDAGRLQYGTDSRPVTGYTRARGAPNPAFGIQRADRTLARKAIGDYMATKKAKELLSRMRENARDPPQAPLILMPPSSGPTTFSPSPSLGIGTRDNPYPSVRDALQALGLTTAKGVKNPPYVINAGTKKARMLRTEARGGKKINYLKAGSQRRASVEAMM